MEKNVTYKNIPGSNIIINADDFGLSDVVNRAIIYSFDNNIINSTSIMATMPFFKQAVEAAKKNEYTDRIGVHVNLTEGKPLTNFNHSLFLNEDGTWNSPEIRKISFGVSSKIKKDFFEEIMAQIQEVKKNGIAPSHINSHHHVHTLPGLFPVFLKICRSQNYKLRIAQTHFSGSYLKNIYRKYINSRIKKYGINFSDFFETIQSYEQRKVQLVNERVEIMVHPSFDGDQLVDVFDKGKSNVALKNILIN